MLGNLISRPAPVNTERQIMLADLATRKLPEGARRQLEARVSSGAISMPDYLRLWETFSFNGVGYVIPGGNMVEMTALQASRDSIVTACIRVRQMVFAEIRFAFQNWIAGAPGKLFGNQSLALLESPWPQGSTSDLLSWLETDASLYGNSYWVIADRPPDKSGLRKMLVRLDPSRVKILTADVNDDVTGLGFGKQLVGYAVLDRKNSEVATFTPSEVCHYRPMPDPKHQFRGLSWLGSLLPDVVADMDLVDYIHSFVRNAATPNLVFQFTDAIGKDAMTDFIDTVESGHTRAQGATKNLYAGSGVDVKVVGSNFQEMALTITESHGETRIAAAAGVPVALVGLSEGLKGAALNMGNFASLRRLFADVTMRPLWRAACASLSTLVPPPAGARLWFDPRDVPFLQADLADAATVRQADSGTMLNLINAGYDPETVVQAIQSGDWGALQHTGLISVQLQPILAATAEAGDVPDPDAEPDTEDKPDDNS